MDDILVLSHKENILKMIIKLVWKKMAKIKIVQSIKCLTTEIELYKNFFKYSVSKFYITAEPYLNKN